MLSGCTNKKRDRKWEKGEVKVRGNKNSRSYGPKGGKWIEKSNKTVKQNWRRLNCLEKSSWEKELENASKRNMKYYIIKHKKGKRRSTQAQKKMKEERRKQQKTCAKKSRRKSEIPTQGSRVAARMEAGRKSRRREKKRKEEDENNRERKQETKKKEAKRKRSRHRTRTTIK